MEIEGAVVACCESNRGKDAGNVIIGIKGALPRPRLGSPVAPFAQGRQQRSKTSDAFRDGGGGGGGGRCVAVVLLVVG